MTVVLLLLLALPCAAQTDAAADPATAAAAQAIRDHVALGPHTSAMTRGEAMAALGVVLTLLGGLGGKLYANLALGLEKVATGQSDMRVTQEHLAGEIRAVTHRVEDHGFSESNINSFNEALRQHTEVVTKLRADLNARRAEQGLDAV